MQSALLRDHSDAAFGVPCQAGLSPRVRELWEQTGQGCPPKDIRAGGGELANEEPAFQVQLGNLALVA